MKRHDTTMMAVPPAQALLRRRQIPRLRRAVTAATTLVVLVFVCGFAAFSIHVAGMRTPRVQPPADAIIVLTGGQARIETAVDLLKAGKGERLLISGVNPVAREIDLQRATGSDARLFACCVDLDHAAVDTAGNAEESAKWMASHAYGRVIVVTNNYHMPRSLLEMRRILDDAELVPHPVVNSRLDGGKWLTQPDALRVLLTEYVKLVAAAMRFLLPDSDEVEHPVQVNAAAEAAIGLP